MDQKKEGEVNKIDLTGKWQFRRRKNSEEHDSVYSDDLGNWMEATVPGTVHTDLMALGKIADPFYRDDESLDQWVCEAEWEYRKEFHIDEKFLESDRVDLVCEGLDTFATIYLNRAEVGACQNMFIPHRFDVRPFLQAGQNEILIWFGSPLRRALALEKQFGKLTSARHSHRVYVRKAQYSFGWDWGPSLPTSGIWRPLYLERVGELRISDVWFKTGHVSEETARVDIEIEVVKSSSRSFRYRVVIEGGKERLSEEVSTDEDRFCCSLEIKNPRLWWPNGYGKQWLYIVKVMAFHGDTLVDETVRKVGIREVHLQLKDEEDKDCFRFVVNGIPIFCKGSNWIPSDSFLPRVTQHDYEKLLCMARDAHMNMIRVWGGGVYEDPIFYQKCDEFGLMVWQDFMFACGGYPVGKDFLDSVVGEVETVLHRLRNHPSLVLWCGNNENEWIWKRETGRPVEEMLGYRIFHEVLPTICKRLDPLRSYWPTSPWGGDDPNDPDEGNHHQWDVWVSWEDFTRVVENEGNFITEFGFQAPANVDTLETCLEPSDRDPRSRVFGFHNKQEEGMERIFRFLSGHQKVITEFDPFIYASQVNQAEALKFCVEHWRRRKFRTAGTLIWQLNDCWPAISWSLIDFGHTPKASYFYAKRFFDGILLSFEKTTDALLLWIVNDTMRNVEGVLEVRILSFEGKQNLSKRVDVEVSPNTASAILAFTEEELSGVRCDSSYGRALLRWDRDRSMEATVFFNRFKDLDFPTGTIEAKIAEKDGETVILELKAPCFLKSVYLHLPGCELYDNYFDIHPHEVKRVGGRMQTVNPELLSEMFTRSLGHYFPQKIHWIG